MRLLLALLAAASASAQPFVRTPVHLGPVVEVAAPASFVVLRQVGEDWHTEFSLLAVRDAEGGLTVLADSLWREPSLVPREAGSRWQVASLGCGTACFSQWYFDPETGRASPPIFAPLYEDEEAGWVIAPGEDGLLLVDPFDPSWAWTLEIPEASPLRTAAMNLFAEITAEDGILVVTAVGVPDEIRAPLPAREP